jgi:serine/threonine-protein kinase
MRRRHPGAWICRRNKSSAHIGSSASWAPGAWDVWLAERIDGLLKRKVALKLPHVSGAAAGLSARLAQERDFLAVLEHPNIARLYDAGVAVDGRPYLALEYVEGEPIDRYCDNRSLDVGHACSW